MLISLRRHRNQLPPNQFDALVLLHHAGRDHRLDLSHSETAPRQAFGGRGHSCSEGFHDATSSFRGSSDAALRAREAYHNSNEPSSPAPGGATEIFESRE